MANIFPAGKIFSNEWCQNLRNQILVTEKNCGFWEIFWKPRGGSYAPPCPYEGFIFGLCIVSYKILRFPLPILYKNISRYNSNNMLAHQILSCCLTWLHVQWLGWKETLFGNFVNKMWKRKQVSSFIILNFKETLN